MKSMTWIAMSKNEVILIKHIEYGIPLLSFIKKNTIIYSFTKFF